MGIIWPLDFGSLLSWARWWLSAGKWVGSTARSLSPSLQQASSTIYLALTQRLARFFHELIYLTNSHSKKLSQKINSFTFFYCSSGLSGSWEGPGSVGVGMKAQAHSYKPEMREWGRKRTSSFHQQQVIRSTEQLMESQPPVHLPKIWLQQAIICQHATTSKQLMLPLHQHFSNCLFQTYPFFFLEGHSLAE